MVVHGDVAGGSATVTSPPPCTRAPLREAVQPGGGGDQPFGSESIENARKCEFSRSMVGSAMDPGTTTCRKKMTPP